MSPPQSDSDSEEEKKRLQRKAKRDRWAVFVDGKNITKIQRPKRTFSLRYPQEMPLLRSATTTTGAWLRHWIEHSFPCPVDAFNLGPPEDPLQDSIQVLIHVHEFEHTDKLSPWVDPVTFTLQIRFFVPPSSGFLVFVSKSPTFAIATYVGDHEDANRPDWVDFRYRPTPAFWVPRCLAIEMARGYLAKSENESVREEAVAWYGNIMAGSFADLKTLHRSSDASILIRVRLRLKALPVHICTLARSSACHQEATVQSSTPRLTSTDPLDNHAWTRRSVGRSWWVQMHMRTMVSNTIGIVHESVHWCLWMSHHWGGLGNKRSANAAMWWTVRLRGTRVLSRRLMS